MLREGAQHVPVSLGFTGGRYSTVLCPTEVQAGLVPSTAKPTFGQSVRNQRALILKYGPGKGDKKVLLFFLMHPEEDPQ